MKFKIVDENNKEFSVNLSDIADMTTDIAQDAAPLEDSDKFSMKDYKCKIYDEEGKEFSFVGCEDNIIKDFSENSPYAVDVTFEATHSGINRNNWNYFSDSMEKDTSSWKSPFPRPLLKNHDIYSEPLGRVTDAYHSKSEFNDERDCINVCFRITDQDAIAKIIDGRYKTLSIGGRVKHVQCNICGKDILKDGIFKFCGHWRGETYNGQKAIWNARDIEYVEGSIVNQPADDWAQIKKITIIKENKNNSSNDSTQDNVYDSIDSLDQDNLNSQVANTNNNNSEDNKSDNHTSLADETATEEEINDLGKKDNSVSVNEDINILQEKIEKSEEVIVDLNLKIKDLSEKNESLKKAADSSKKEIALCNDKVIKLSVELKSLMIKRALDFSILSKETRIEDYEEKKSELVKKSAKELSEINKNIDFANIKIEEKNNNSSTSIPKVNNPSVVNLGDKNSIIDNNSETVVEKKDKYVDIENSIIESIYR